MPKLNCDIEAQAFCAPDRRADGGVRIVRLTQAGVRIERAFGGVRMSLAIPIQAYQGVLLIWDRLDRRLCRIILAHRDPDKSVTLHQGVDAPAVSEIWLNWARFFGRPALCTGIFGEGAAPTGRLRRSPPKRRSLLRGRMPRTETPAKVLRGARELISWE